MHKDLLFSKNQGILLNMAVIILEVFIIRTWQLQNKRGHFVIACLVNKLKSNGKEKFAYYFFKIRSEFSVYY
ncbi:hypothetical protein COL26_18945 [Bacillus thuringiensis]|uniref:Uncharacterized protein n=1 Tax=Bacillus thuringiensis TaxID=1428 RepID=A0ABD6RUK5_BACTU|nr:hypothetical protein CN495_32875 [Bacillus thuringiensis]PFI03154.1 hypothetical protein COI79_29725 [Bacillus thuringiensis]PFW37234.1 hypothetical protein COL26_18945 [Bacillus thuringiensis]